MPDTGCCDFYYQGGYTCCSASYYSDCGANFNSYYTCVDCSTINYNCGNNFSCPNPTDCKVDRGINIRLLLYIIGFALVLVILVVCCVKSQRRARRNNANRNADDVVVGEASPELDNQRLIENDKPPLINTVDQGVPGDLLLPSAEELH